MPAATPGRWPVDDRVRARVARRYFVDRATKVEVAAEFGLTRFQVAKLVQDCLDDGTVTITVRGPDDVDDALSARLAARYGLRDALVGADVASVSRYAAAMAAAHLADGAVLALGGGPAVADALAAADRLPRCEVVPARGVAGLDDHGIELVTRVARACGGTAYPVYAPFLARRPEDAAALRAHPLVEVALGRLDHVACAVLGVEGPGSGWWDGLRPEDADLLAAAGALAAVGPVPVGADGAPRASELDARAIGLTAAQLRRVPFVLLADAGPERAVLLDAALGGGLVHAVVTDAPTAAALLALPGAATG